MQAKVFFILSLLIYVLGTSKAQESLSDLSPEALNHLREYGLLDQWKERRKKCKSLSPELILLQISDTTLRKNIEEDKTTDFRIASLEQNLIYLRHKRKYQTALRSSNQQLLEDKYVWDNLQKIYTQDPDKIKYAVTDVTSSMSPYIEEFLLWNMENAIEYPKGKCFFFNDGNGTLNDQKYIGETGGIYQVANANLSDLLRTIREAIRKGNGGDIPENDLEALLKAQDQAQQLAKGKDIELILIADNKSPVRDLELLKQLKYPVRVILCGAQQKNAKVPIRTDYIAIAYMTNGSIHIRNKDCWNVREKYEGQLFYLKGRKYELKDGNYYRFVRGESIFGRN
ncbi:MAG: hypothetical protein MK212_02950 [Saprospiraceae bacterium]|nr:hypothetical protein [Saprospiraceae bacterium]